MNENLPKTTSLGGYYRCNACQGMGQVRVVATGQIVPCAGCGGLGQVYVQPDLTVSQDVMDHADRVWGSPKWTKR